jgi:hypothetical protein
VSAPDPSRLAPEPLAPEIEALALAELAKRVKARTDLTKALIGQRYPDGHKETFRSPVDGRKLGIVYRTDPDPQWRVTDRAAFDKEARTYPGNLETVVSIAEEDMPEALAVLAEHAPRLLTETVRLRAGIVEAALAQSEATGQAAAAGIERMKAPGSLTVKPDPAAGSVVEALVNAGLLAWDMRPALPAAEAEAS